MFGIQVLQLALESRPVWNSILALSRTSKDLLHSTQRADEIDETASSDVQEDATTVALLRVLSSMKQYTADISTAWVSPRGADLAVLAELSQHTVGRNLNAAIYWLFLRLGMLISRSQ